MTRNLDTHPYTPDEKRVAVYIVRITEGNVGAGDDPIGWLIASHEMMALDRRQAILEGRVPC